MTQLAITQPTGRRALARRTACATLLCITVGACARPATHATTTIAPASSRSATLKDAFRGVFLVGGAINARQVSGQDTLGAALVAQQFSTITPENALKWESVHPRPGVYDFAVPDQYVDFGVRHQMFVVGHTLVWHNQTPAWVFKDAQGNAVSRDTLLARMRDHIFTVVGRYKGRIGGWDVVNEALNEDGTLRKSPWYTIIGEDYITKAFQFAHQADPSADLYYNDYSVENAPKRSGAVALIKRLQAAGIRVKAIGLQGHDKLDWPTLAQQDSTIAAFGALGLKVNITELDVDVLPSPTQNRSADVSLNLASQPKFNPYPGGLPDSVQKKLADRYAGLFGVYLRHRTVVNRITFWGVADGDSWLNNWPIRGRTSYPLLFDRQHQPKPAFDAVIRAVRQGAATRM